MPTTARDSRWLDRLALIFFTGLALIELGYLIDPRKEIHHVQ